jgi:hypothetical protein
LGGVPRKRLFFGCNLWRHVIGSFRYSGLKSFSEIAGEDFMFDSLAEKIKHDEHLQISNAERYTRWVGVAILSVAVFGGLFYL